MLKIENLSVTYNGNRVINALNLTVKKNIIMGIVGPNGAGKTTLLKSVLNMVSFKSGKIYFGTRLLNGLAIYQIIKLGISFTAQHIQTLDGMRVIENVLIGMQESVADSFLRAFLKSKTTKRIEQERREKAMELLEMVGLSEKAEDFAGTLSFGQKKRLDIARALASDPYILLMDEPTAGLDVDATREILELLKIIKNGGNTILLVEHNMDVVRNICDEVVVLNNGEKLAQGRPEEVLNIAKVVQVYLGG